MSDRIRMIGLFLLLSVASSAVAQENADLKAQEEFNADHQRLEQLRTTEPPPLILDKVSGQELARSVFKLQRSNSSDKVVLYEGADLDMDTVTTSALATKHRGIDNTMLVRFRWVKYLRKVDFSGVRTDAIAAKIESETNFVFHQMSEGVSIIEPELANDPEWPLNKPVLPAIGQDVEQLTFSQAERLLEENFSLWRESFGRTREVAGDTVVWTRKGTPSDLTVRELAVSMLRINNKVRERPSVFQIMPHRYPAGYGAPPGAILPRWSVVLIGG